MYIKVILVSAFVATAYAAPPELPHLDGRIVGGQPAEIEDFPYQLSLQYNGGHICGASIVSKNIAITAAHCTDGAPTSALSVRAGSSKRDSGGQVVKVKKIHQHPNYNSGTIDYDITVLELAGDIKLGESAQSIALPKNGEQAPVGAVATCTGWGSLNEGGSSSTKLQSVDVNIVSRQVCRDGYGSSKITDRMVCAGVSRGGKDACQGDSGGPLVVNGKLVGVVSWGYGCARPQYPGVYADVGNLRDYISKVGNL